MGWDTVDELLCKFYHWKVVTDESLHVKHLKPTGASYNLLQDSNKEKLFYTLGYGFLSQQLFFKISHAKGKPLLFLDYIKGFGKSKERKQNHAGYS